MAEVLRRQLPEEDHAPLLALIRESFAYMEARIDPPSSMHRLTEETLAAQAAEGEIWRIDAGGRLVACVVLTPQEDALYLGKLAVAKACRGRGLARRLVDRAKQRALALGLPRVRLNSRVELTENHAAFARMGFEKVGDFTHPGFDRPTSMTMACEVGA